MLIGNDVILQFSEKIILAEFIEGVLSDLIIEGEEEKEKYISKRRLL